MKTPEEKAKHAAYMREYYRRKKAENPEAYKSTMRIKAAKDRMNPNVVAYREAFHSTPENKIKARARAKAWRLANPEKYKENMRRAHMRNAKARAEKAAVWKKSNPERAKVNAIECLHRRRARKNGNGEVDHRTVPFTRIVKLIESFTCCYCGERKAEVPTIEHVNPLSRGGKHVLENLELACAMCNLSKGAKTPEEFAAYMMEKRAIMAAPGTQLVLL